MDTFLFNALISSCEFSQEERISAALTAKKYVQPALSTFSSSFREDNGKESERIYKVLHASSFPKPEIC
ncbi:hypothetical protein A8C56_21925 [Niabella ginsenosidivorans]|uniref:Uncharacterized protein n=1 Tax=Niabella ginsenosidivorans TaxID=1176587 RepID=A0A1A9I9S0_9BACT|nr:hypothetical protein A8C56_21925 [Niabella ginsenosidivorans]